MKKHGMTLCRGCNFERGAVQRLRYWIGCHTFESVSQNNGSGIESVSVKEGRAVTEPS